MPQVVQHIVLFPYHEHVTEEQRKEVSERFFALGRQCRINGAPFIMAINGGKNNSPEPPAKGIDHAYIVTFRSKEDRDHYLTDPAHLEFVEFIKDKVDMAKVKVADFETGTF